MFQTSSNTWWRSSELPVARFLFIPVHSCACTVFTRFHTLPPQTLVHMVFNGWFSYRNRARACAGPSAPDKQRTRRALQGNPACHTRFVRMAFAHACLSYAYVPRWCGPLHSGTCTSYVSFLYTHGVIRRVVLFVARSFLCYVRIPLGAVLPGGTNLQTSSAWHPFPPIPLVFTKRGMCSRDFCRAKPLLIFLQTFGQTLFFCTVIPGYSHKRRQLSNALAAALPPPHLRPLSGLWRGGAPEPTHPLMGDRGVRQFFLRLS